MASTEDMKHPEGKCLLNYQFWYLVCQDRHRHRHLGEPNILGCAAQRKDVLQVLPRPFGIPWTSYCDVCDMSPQLSAFAFDGTN